MKQITLVDGSNSFTWHDNSQGTILRSFEGFEYASVRQAIEDIPARDGSIYIESRFGRRRLGWSGDLIPTSSESVFAKRRNQINSMSQGSLKTLKFTTYDDLELQTNVEIQKLVMPYNHKTHSYMVEAVAPDYRFYSQALKTYTTTPTTSTGGTQIPTPIPMALTFSGGVAKLGIVNDGNESSPPTFIIRGPGTNFIVQNISTGKYFRLNLTLNLGETVTVDVVNRTITKGSNQNVYGSFSGDWWMAQPGAQQVHFNASSGTDSNTLLTVQLRDAYRGV